MTDARKEKAPSSSGARAALDASRSRQPPSMAAGVATYRWSLAQLARLLDSHECFERGGRFMRARVTTGNPKLRRIDSTS